MIRRSKNKEYVSDGVSNFKKGIDIERAKFKMGKMGQGANNFDLMCDALENIKSDVKSRLENEGYKKVITYVEKRINWYRSKEVIYSKRTENGFEVVYPPMMNVMINQRLTQAYERLVKYLDKLDLL